MFKINNFRAGNSINQTLIYIALLKLVLTVLSLFCIIFVGINLTNSYLDKLNMTKSLNNDIEKIIAQSEIPQFQNKKKLPDKGYKIIYEKNLFGVLGVAQPPTPIPVSKAVSKVPLNLVGTFILSDTDSSAIIEDPKRAIQDAFNKNDSIFGIAKLVAIYNDKVEIERDGVIEILKLDSDLEDSGTNASGDVIFIEESEIDQALSNLPVLLTQLRAVPYFKDGQAIGLRLFAIKPGSLFDKIGLKNGDILKTINGNNLGDFSQAVKLFEKLKAERNIKLSLERNREDKEYKYQVK